jgi:restriction system protein
MQNMWMVRAGRDAFLIDDFKNNNYVAIGWNEIGDISKVKSRDEIKNLLQKKYTYSKKNELNIDTGQVSRFLFDFKKEDYVLSYDNVDRIYLVGKITGDYYFDKSKRDYYHTRKVEWLEKVPRDNYQPQQEIP